MGWNEAGLTRGLAIALVSAATMSCSGGAPSSGGWDHGSASAAPTGGGGDGTSATGGGDPTASGSGGAVGGSGSSSGAGTPSGGDDGDAGLEPACLKGLLKPSQIVMLGDSYLDPAFSNAALDLYANAQTAGTLAANTTYRHYYLAGAAMSSGIGQLNIPYQYEQMARKDDPDIQVVVMDGGGNDVLITDRSCLTSAPPQNAGCAKTIDAALLKAKEEMAVMGADGVKQIVYFFYPHLDSTKSDGLLVGGASAVNETLDYAYPMARGICEGSISPKCYFVDTRAAFEGHTDEYIKPDRVHPTPAGAQVIADLVWKTMVANCVAQ